MPKIPERVLNSLRAAPKRTKFRRAFALLIAMLFILGDASQLMAALISELDIGDNQDNYLDAYGGFANPHLLDHGIDLENPLFEIPDYFYGYWEEVLPVQSHYGVIGAMASIAPFNSPNLVTTPPLVSAAYISTPQELTQFLNSDLGFEDNYGHFRITANIDMSSEPATRGRAGVFSGILDGNGHTVTNLRLEPNEEYLIQVPAYVAAPINGVSQIRAIGLVQQLGEGGRIRNLTLHNDEDLAFYNNLIAPPNQHQTSSALQVISDRNYLYHWNHALIPSYVGMFAGTVLSGEAFLQNVHLTGHTVFKNNIQSPTSGTGVSDNSTRQGIDVAARSQTFGGLVGSVVGGTLNIVDSSVYNLEFTMGHGGSLPTAAGNFIPPHYEGGAPRSFGGLVGSAYSGTTNITTATQGFRTTIGIRTNTFIGSEGNNGTGSTARDISRRINYVGGVIARVNGGNINISNVTTTGRAGFNRTGFTIISQAVGLHPPVGEGANLINPIPHTANFNIVANRRAGGIIGYTRSHNVRIRDVMNYLNVRVANDITTAVVGGAAAGLGNAGGIVGRSNGNNLYIRNAGNMGKVVQHRLGANLQAPAATRNNNHSGAGGIVGHSSGNSLSINTSFNAGAIDGNHSGAGGILGHNGAGNTTLTNVYNIGSVASRARLGGNGLVGRNRAGHVTIENAFVAANVTGVAVGARAMGNNPGGNQAHNRLLGFTLSNVYVDFEVLTPPGQINGHINTATSATGFAIPSLGANRGNSDRSQSASGLGQAANVTGVTTELLTRGTLPGISVGAANSPWRTGIQGVDASVFRTYPHFYWQIPGGERAEQFFTGISPSIGHMYTDNEYSYEREAVFTIVSGANSAFANLTPYRFFHTYRFPGLLIGTGNNPAINYPTFATHDPITDPVMAVHNFTRPAALRTNVGIINPQGIIGFTIGSMELSLYMRVLHYETLEPIHGSRLTSQNFVEGAEISGINGEFYLSQRWDAAAGYGIITVRAPHFRPYGYNNPDHPQYGVAHITHLVTLDDMESRLIEWHFIPWHEDVIGWMRYERTEAQIQSDTPGDVITRTHFEFEREEVFQPRLSNYSFDLAHLLAGERITARLPYQGFAENDFIYDSPMLRWEYTHIDPDYPQFNEGNWHLDVYMRDVTLDGNPLRRLRIFEIASPLGFEHDILWPQLGSGAQNTHPHPGTNAGGDPVLGTIPANELRELQGTLSLNSDLNITIYLRNPHYTPGTGAFPNSPTWSPVVGPANHVHVAGQVGTALNWDTNTVLGSGGVTLPWTHDPHLQWYSSGPFFELDNITRDTEFRLEFSSSDPALNARFANTGWHTIDEFYEASGVEDFQDEYGDWIFTDVNGNRLATPPAAFWNYLASHRHINFPIEPVLGRFYIEVYTPVLDLDGNPIAGAYDRVETAHLFRDGLDLQSGINDHRELVSGVRTSTGRFTDVAISATHNMLVRAVGFADYNFSLNPAMLPLENNTYRVILQTEAPGPYDVLGLIRYDSDLAHSPYAFVTLINSDGRIYRTTNASVAGTFEFRNVTPGTYTLIATSEETSARNGRSQLIGPILVDGAEGIFEYVTLYEDLGYLLLVNVINPGGTLPADLQVFMEDNYPNTLDNNNPNFPSFFVYETETLPTGNLVASAEGYISANYYLTSSHFPAGFELVTLVIRREAVAALHFEVTGSAGIAMAGVEITIPALGIVTTVNDLDHLGNAITHARAYTEIPNTGDYKIYNFFINHPGYEIYNGYIRLYENGTIAGFHRTDFGPTNPYDGLPRYLGDGIARALYEVTLTPGDTQASIVYGRVTAAGTPLAGANVSQIGNSSRYAITDSDGWYVLIINAYSTTSLNLVASYQGFNPSIETANVPGRRDFELEPEDENMILLYGRTYLSVLFGAALVNVPAPYTNITFTNGEQVITVVTDSNGWYAVLVPRDVVFNTEVSIIGLDIKETTVNTDVETYQKRRDFVVNNTLPPEEPEPEEPPVTLVVKGVLDSDHTAVLWRFETEVTYGTTFEALAPTVVSGHTLIGSASYAIVIEGVLPGETLTHKFFYDEFEEEEEPGDEDNNEDEEPEEIPNNRVTVYLINYNDGESYTISSFYLHLPLGAAITIDRPIIANYLPDLARGNDTELVVINEDPAQYVRFYFIPIEPEIEPEPEPEYPEPTPQFTQVTIYIYKDGVEYVPMRSIFTLPLGEETIFRAPIVDGHVFVNTFRAFYPPSLQTTYDRFVTVPALNEDGYSIQFHYRPLEEGEVAVRLINTWMMLDSDGYLIEGSEVLTEFTIPNVEDEFTMVPNDTHGIYVLVGGSLTPVGGVPVPYENFRTGITARLGEAIHFYYMLPPQVDPPEPEPEYAPIIWVSDILVDEDGIVISENNRVYLLLNDFVLGDNFIVRAGNFAPLNTTITQIYIIPRDEHGNNVGDNIISTQGARFYQLHNITQSYLITFIHTELSEASLVINFVDAATIPANGDITDGHIIFARYLEGLAPNPQLYTIARQAYIHGINWLHESWNSSYAWFETEGLGIEPVTIIDSSPRTILNLDIGLNALWVAYRSPSPITRDKYSLVIRNQFSGDVLFITNARYGTLYQITLEDIYNGVPNEYTFTHASHALSGNLTQNLTIELHFERTENILQNESRGLIRHFAIGAPGGSQLVLGTNEINNIELVTAISAALNSSRDISNIIPMPILPEIEMDQGTPENEIEYEQENETNIDTEQDENISEEVESEEVEMEEIENDYELETDYGLIETETPETENEAIEYVLQTNQTDFLTSNIMASLILPPAYPPQGLPPIVTNPWDLIQLLESLQGAENIVAYIDRFLNEEFILMSINYDAQYGFIIDLIYLSDLSLVNIYHNVPTLNMLFNGNLGIVSGNYLLTNGFNPNPNSVNTLSRAELVHLARSQNLLPGSVFNYQPSIFELRRHANGTPFILVTYTLPFSAEDLRNGEQDSIYYNVLVNAVVNGETEAQYIDLNLPHDILPEYMQVEVDFNFGHREFVEFLLYHWDLNDGNYINGFYVTIDGEDLLLERNGTVYKFAERIIVRDEDGVYHLVGTTIGSFFNSSAGEVNPVQFVFTIISTETELEPEKPTDPEDEDNNDNNDGEDEPNGEPAPIPPTPRPPLRPTPQPPAPEEPQTPQPQPTPPSHQPDQGTAQGGGAAGTAGRPVRERETNNNNVVSNLPTTNIHRAYRYVLGFRDNSFRPDNGITRAEMAQMFFNLSTNPNRFGHSFTNFNDVSATGWYFEAISYFASRGVLVGFPDGYFRPNQYITNAEFAQFAAGVFALSPIAAIDYNIGHWSEQAVNATFNQTLFNYFNGNNTYTFHRDEIITRAEAVTTINYHTNRNSERSTILQHLQNRQIYTDLNENHWAFFQIMDASLNHSYTRDTANLKHWITMPVHGWVTR